MNEPPIHADFEKSSWHDCRIWSIEFLVGDSDEDDWTSDLAFGIDYIVEWICGAEGGTKFRVAPARLVFHGVTDPTIKLDWGSSGFQVAPCDLTIDRIARGPVRDQKVYLHRCYYHWTVELHPPVCGSIEFGAVDFSQSLLAEPIVSDRQYFSLRERSRLTGR
jgi:hypothetical protein